ncbi:hypothetical protein NDU88_003163 [Pleurodeles waltl]|uniref:Uncharacterized protein n=1 Tax=Pleurodeles waltl TaxID=8319 RepID=A0AAV7NKN6_PLEWA|nr:hypothetical protein NDU88_003163 [Pleurodeles waltl]
MLDRRLGFGAYWFGGEDYEEEINVCLITGGIVSEDVWREGLKNDGVLQKVMKMIPSGWSKQKECSEDVKSQDGGCMKRRLHLGLTFVLLKLLLLGDRKRGSEPGEASNGERKEAPTEGRSMSLECGAHV